MDIFSAISQWLGSPPSIVFPANCHSQTEGRCASEINGGSTGRLCSPVGEPMRAIFLTVRHIGFAFRVFASFSRILEGITG